jgi:hypothetical protein
VKKSVSIGLVALALVATRTYADDLTRYQDVLEWYEEQPLGIAPFTAAGRQKALLTVFKGAGTSAIAQTGTTVVVPNISAPLSSSVSGNDPPCGDGKASDASVIGDSFAKGGAVMAVVAIGTGGSGAVGIGVIGGLMSIAGLSIGDSGPHAKTANCGVATLVLSGHYTDAQVIPMISASFQNKGGELFKPVEINRDLAWARTGGITTKQTEWKIDPASDFANTLGIMRGGQLQAPLEKPETCPVTMVAIRVKNWSDDRTRSFYISADTSKSEVPEGSCLDASFINKRLYGAEYVKALGPEILAEYEKWVFARIDKTVN